MDHAPAKLALLGGGRVGEWHARGIRRHLPNVELLAIAEPRAEAIAALGENVGSATIYDTALEALAHPGLDGCIVGLPTDAHYDAVTAALELNLDVFCEKPLTLNIEQSRTLEKLAADRGRVLQIGFWRRFHPPIAKGKQLLADGAIGRPLFSKLTQWDVDAPPVPWCALDMSGGIFVDMGVHEFDQIEWWLDDQVVSVEAKPLPRVISELETVEDFDNVAIWFTLASGGQGMIDLSRNGRYADDIRIEVLGSEGALFVETVPSGRLRVGTRGGMETVWEDTEDDSFIAGLAREIAAFTLVRSGRTDIDIPRAAASIRATGLGQAALRSARSGKPEPTPLLD
jgi:scyllo-inositol 2-dehydrogenase (NAD+)